VGIAYFVIAVLIPLGLYISGAQPWPKVTTNGLVFSGLAGVAGAIGALCVVFATQNAVASAKAASLPPATYKMFIAPLIFGMAPVINVLVSTFWHPEEGGPLDFGIRSLPGWKMWLGMALVGAGAFLVLMSKEEKEAGHKPAAVAPIAPGGQNV